jgi:hypothetical protein
MNRTANTFRADLKPMFGLPQIKPRIGEAFDVNNDLHLLDACTVLHRDGHITRGTAASVTHDALIDWNRRHMTREAFNDFYGDDDRSEMMMLHGANG